MKILSLQESDDWLEDGDFVHYTRYALVTTWWSPCLVELLCTVLVPYWISRRIGRKTKRPKLSEWTHVPTYTVSDWVSCESGTSSSGR